MKKKNKKKNKLNNKRIIIKLIIVIVLIIVVILSIVEINNNRVTKDEKKFKLQYENFNNRKNLSNVKYLNVSIPDKNRVKYLASKEVIKFMRNKTGVLFFCYQEGGFCRKSAEVLIDVAIDDDINNIYYYNAYGDRDEKYVSENGEIITINKSKNDYEGILKILGNKAEPYYGLGDDSIKRLYFPTVLFIKNGKILKMHSGTVTSDSKEQKKLNTKQYRELKKIYHHGIKRIVE